MFGLKDYLVRKLATSFLLKWVDGHKTTIFRVVQAVNSSLVALFVLCPHLPAVNGELACAVADQLNAQWMALSVVVGQLGLEFGIQDAKAKARLAEKVPGKV